MCISLILHQKNLFLVYWFENRISSVSLPGWRLTWYDPGAGASWTSSLPCHWLRWTSTVLFRHWCKIARGAPVLGVLSLDRLLWMDFITKLASWSRLLVVEYLKWALSSRSREGNWCCAATLKGVRAGTLNNAWNGSSPNTYSNVTT